MRATIGVQASRAAPCRLSAPSRTRARLCTSRPLQTRVFAQQGLDDGAPSAAAAAEQQQFAAAAPPAEAAAQAQQLYEEAATAAADAAHSAAAAAEQHAAAAVQAVAPPSAPRRPAAPFGLSLQHPAVRVGGAVAAVFLGGTLLLTLWRMARDPQRKRSKTINKNKLVVDTIGKYLPGNRAAMSASSFSLLKLQTGFTGAELFRKYLWFLLRERQFDDGAVADLQALRAALGLSDEEVAEALRERAQRVYEKYGTVMVNLEGMSQSGIERKAAARNLFMKLLSLSESRSLLSAEAATAVDLSKIFGVTPRDVLTLRSGYSAEAEGAALEEGEGGEE